MKKNEELTSSQEDYLEMILMIEREKGAVHSVDVSQGLNVSKPSVCRAMSVLRNMGYLWLDGDKRIHLTPRGIRAAEKVYERHRFFQEQLMAAGVDEKQAGIEACRLEHAVSEESFEKLREAVWLKPRRAAPSGTPRK